MDEDEEVGTQLPREREEKPLTAIEVILRPGLRTYTLEMIHSRVYRINSFKPQTKDRKLDRTSLEKYLEMRLLELPKFKHVEYVQLNGDPIKIRVSYPNEEPIEWTPAQTEIPAKERDKLEEFRKYKDLLTRDIEAEKRDYEELQKRQPKVDPKVAFSPYAKFKSRPRK